MRNDSEGMDGRGVVDGAFRILRALPRAAGERQIATLSGLTGIPRPSVYRLLAQLVAAGAVERRAARWVLAPGLLALAQDVEPLHGLRETAAQVIRVLRAETGGAVSLVAPGGDGFVALEMVPGWETMRIDARSGAAMPAGTAAARVLAEGRRRSQAAVEHGAELDGLSCYAVPVALPGGGRVALQVATREQPAQRFAASVHRAATALERRLVR